MGLCKIHYCHLNSSGAILVLARHIDPFALALYKVLCNGFCGVINHLIAQVAKKLATPNTPEAVVTTYFHLFPFAVGAHCWALQFVPQFFHFLLSFPEGSVIFIFPCVLWLVRFAVEKVVTLAGVTPHQQRRFVNRHAKIAIEVPIPFFRNILPTAIAHSTVALRTYNLVASKGLHNGRFTPGARPR